MRRGQFYGIRYYSKKFRDSMKEAERFDYSQFYISRSIHGWGSIKEIGSYPCFIRHVNDRMKKK